VPRLRSLLIAAGAIALALSGVVFLQRADVTAPPMQMVLLTTLPGSEYGPTFSPDGQHVAFAWDGGDQANSDIYEKLVGSTEVRQLTTDAATDVAPQWSPDGKSIAYARQASPTSHRLRIMSSLGASDRGLDQFPIRPPAAWTTDGRYLIAGRASEGGTSDSSTGLYLIPFELGQPRQITRNTAPASDGWPAFSPNGRQVAYASCRELVLRTNCHIQVLDLDASLTPIGSPRRLTRGAVWAVHGIAWTRDGQFVIYAARQGALVHLWRVEAGGQHPPVRIEVAGLEAYHPATTPKHDRLAFSRLIQNAEMYRLEIGGVPQLIAPSSVNDVFPQISPDGQRIVYCSARSGETLEVWVAGLDGSKPEQLTRGFGRWQCSPTWSPDGQRIAFDSQAEDGSWHIWTIDAGGGGLQQITNAADDQVRPTWSADGNWIYFLRFRDTDRDVWRTRGPNQPYEPVTHGGSWTYARESPDSTGVYHKPPQPDTRLLFQPLPRGVPRPVIACVASPQFSVWPEGIYYVPCRSSGVADRSTPFHLFNPQTGQDRSIATLEGAATFISVSRDGKTIVYGRQAGSGADLMLIENFK
jgi:Tol biopolymer transport system component